jgi:4-amino-4-deoxy-L-arabinose transferase-like glycosyltransferase
MARDISWDIFCHSFMMGAIWLLHRALTRDSWKDYILSGILMGLSALSKGPVAFYALLLPYLLARGFVYGLRGFEGRKIKITTLILIALVLGFWWPVYTYIVNPAISVSLAQKESSAWISHNIKPFFHYWSFPAQSGIWTISATIALIFPYARQRVNKFLNYRLVAGWIWFAVLLLSLFPEKKERYLLPVLIPLAIVTAGYFRYLIKAYKQKINTRSDTVLLRLNAFVFALICITIPNGLFFLSRGKTEPAEWVLFALTALFIIFAFVFIKNNSLRGSIFKKRFFI